MGVLEPIPHGYQRMTIPLGYPAFFLQSMLRKGVYELMDDLVKNTDEPALSEAGGPGGQVSDVPRGLSEG